MAQRQDKPSYEKTVRFLQEKINADTRHNNGDISSVRIVEMSRCEMAAVYYSSRADYVQVSVFAVRYLDPSRTELMPDNILGDRVRFYTRRNEKVLPSFRIENSRYSQIMRNASLGNCRSSFQAGIYSNQNISRLINFHPDNWVCDSDQSIKQQMADVGVFGVLPPTSDNAPRVHRALTHLIRLCGGQEELF